MVGYRRGGGGDGGLDWSLVLVCVVVCVCVCVYSIQIYGAHYSSRPTQIEPYSTVQYTMSGIIINT